MSFEPTLDGSTEMLKLLSNTATTILQYSTIFSELSIFKNDVPYKRKDPPRLKGLCCKMRFPVL